MKVCTICGQAKAKSDYFYRNRKLEKLHSQCKACYIEKRRAIWREHYHKYGSKYRERAVERNRRIKNKLRQYMLDYLRDKACERCGIRDIRVLEFDHINPKQKTFTIARGMTNTLSWESILAEIKRCQILCANCHKIRTSEQQVWYKNLPNPSTELV